MDRLPLLKSISFGARVAEDETNALATYFVETDQWARIARGEIDVIRGDKGAGKSAIYSLLNARADNFFDDNILLVSAEKPRGATVFSNLTADPPPTEADFVALWKLYIASIITQKIYEFGIGGDAARELTGILSEQGLLDTGFDIAIIFRKVLAYAKSWVKSEVEPSITVDQITGSASFSVRIKPNDAFLDVNSVSVDKLLKLANSALRDADITVWVLLDRLDVAFSEDRALETNALRALFRVYRDIADLDNIRLKIFIRTDIWRRITETGFAEASHITKFAVLEWPHSSLLNLIIRRLISNQCIVDDYELDEQMVLNNFEAQKELFYIVFPSQVDQGSRKPSTLDWLISRCADGAGKTAPRELIHLLNALLEKEIARMERGEPAAVGKQLFDRSVFKLALPDVSEARLIQTLYAEYPDLRPYIAKLAGEKTEQTVDALGILWGTDTATTVSISDRLVEVGFFQRKSVRDSDTLWVPFLYRDALKMIQGLADDA